MAVFRRGNQLTTRVGFSAQTRFSLVTSALSPQAKADLSVLQVSASKKTIFNALLIVIAILSAYFACARVTPAQAALRFKPLMVVFIVMAVVFLNINIACFIFTTNFNKKT